MLRIFFPILVLFLAACGQHPTLNKNGEKDRYWSVRNQLQGFIKEEMKRNKITGLSLAIVDENRTVWAQGFGYADKAQGIQADSNTLYRVGSLSKLMNTMLLMRMQEQGRVNIDSPLSAYLPEFSIRTRHSDLEDITLRSMLHHHSGLPSDWIMGMWRYDPAHFSSLLPPLRQEYVAFPPNTVLSYSNVAHSLLGMVIAKGFGGEYSQVLKRELLTPLGMNDAFFASELQQGAYAKSYERGKRAPELGLRDVPAAGLNAHVNDLSQFIKFIHSEGELNRARYISRASMSETYRVQNANVSLDMGKRLGLGWFFYDNIFSKRELVVGHSGATINHRAQLKIMPKRKIGVVILANSANSSQSLHRISNRALRLMYKAKYSREGSFPRRNTIDKRDVVDREKISGHYATLAGAAKIVRKGEKLSAELINKKFRLKPTQEGWYQVKYKLFGLFPMKVGFISRLSLTLRTVEGRQLLLATPPSGPPMVLGEKITQVPLPSAWRERVGHYEIRTPLDVTAIHSGGLKVKEGFLVAYGKLESGEYMEFYLQPVNDNEAIVAGLGRGFGQTVHARTDEVGPYLFYAGMKFRRTN